MDEDLNRRVRRMISTDRNLLRSGYNEIKPNVPISSGYAWSRQLVGRPSSVLFAEHLDDWQDNAGTMLKFKARTGVHGTASHMAGIHRLPLTDACCYMCCSGAVEDVRHMLLHCRHTAEDRDAMMRKVRNAQGPHHMSSRMASFEDGNDEHKLKVLLGMPSGCKLEDAKVDRAVKCFLLKVERERRRCCSRLDLP